jgi:hypothetical protein
MKSPISFDDLMKIGFPEERLPMIAGLDPSTPTANKFGA